MPSEQDEAKNIQEPCRLAQLLYTQIWSFVNYSLVLQFILLLLGV
jgi:hypothetical protein